MLDEMREAMVAHALRIALYGRHCMSPLGASRLLVTEGVELIAYALKKEGSNVRLGVETNGKLGPDNVRGLIIYTGRETVVIPMAISPSLVRIRKKPVFLDHESGAVALVRAILAEVELAVEAEAAARQ